MRARGKNLVHVFMPVFLVFLLSMSYIAYAADRTVQQTRPKPITVTPGGTPGISGGPVLSKLASNYGAFNPPATVTGTVTLSGPAPSGDALIALSSGNPGSVVVPQSVTVPAGQTSATFQISGATYTSNTQTTITAMYRGDSKTISMWVQPGSDVESLLLSAPSVIGGTSVNATVRIRGAAPAAGVVIPLATAGPTTSITVPSSVTVPAGQQQVTFPLATQPVTVAQTVAICAKNPDSTSHPCAFGGWIGNEGKELVLTPSGVSIDNLQIFVVLQAGGTYTGPSADVGAGDSGYLKISLNAPAPSGGAVVTLTNSNPNAAVVPPSITIAAGQNNGQLGPIVTQTVPALTAVTISASYGGVTKTVQMNVRSEATVAAFSITPASISGGTLATATVTLDRPAPAGGTTVTIVSSNPSVASAPPTVTVAAGQTSAAVSIATQSVSVAAQVTISASYGGVTKTSTVTVTR